MIYRIVLGDWSNDGHGRTQVYDVNVTGATKETLIENYKRNIEIIGFDPEKLCEEYEDSSWPEDVIDKLLAVGYRFPDEFDKEDKYYDDWLTQEVYIDMLMFFATYRLEGVHYAFANDQVDYLFGGSGFGSFGYGYFYN